MAWGNSGNVTTVHLDAATDDPSQARVELYNALIELAAVINGRGTANGVAPLDASTKIDAQYLPDEINSSTSNNLILAPDSTRVAIEDIINLATKTTAQLEALDTAGDAIEGDVAYCSDGDAGAKCIAVFNGSDWLRISLGAAIATS
jgi:hypothetical protein